jgi:hypothetical protein
VLAATGGAVAAKGDQSKPKDRNALLADVAKRLGIDAAKLEGAFEAAAIARVDAALAAGQITEKKAARLKARIEAGKMPILARPHGPRGFAFGRRGHGAPLLAHGPRRFRSPLAPAATYLGMTRQELVAQLRDGKSLADVARAKGKSVDGLKQAILSAMTAGLKAHVDALVERSPAFGRRP